MTDARITPDALQPWAILGVYLRLLAPNARLFRYSCETCFRQLWDMAEGRPVTRACDCIESPPLCAATADEERETADDSETFIICYDGTPAAYTRPDALPNIHLDGAFSPMSLYTLLARQAERGAAPAPPRWIVIDAHGRTDSGMFALAQIFAPQVTLLDADALECRGRTLRELMSASVPASTSGPRQVEAAERHLQALLTAPGRRHAVSNIVGPVMLGFEPRQPEVAWAVSHLRRMLTSLDTSSRWDGGGEATGPWLDAAALTAGGPVEFVLVDDQYRNGWGQVLCNALGAKFEDDGQRGLHHIGVTPDGGLNVSVSASAEFLLDKLERAGAGDLRFGLRLGTEGLAREILLLDLRLFEGLSLREEAAFIARGAAIARARFRQRRGLPYPGFTDSELDSIDSWLERARLCGGAEADAQLRAEATYLRALALLPRLVALTDLSLPVIIFSSTGQREITELLKEYGSIITTFEKPRLFGYQQEDLRARTRASFRSAVERAEQLLAAKAVCTSLLRYAAHTTAPRPKWDWASHLELYIDESGSSVVPGDAGAKNVNQRRFVVAGLLVAYKRSKGDAGPEKGLHRQMEAEGLRWWPESLEGEYMVKRKPVDPWLDLPGGRYEPPNRLVSRFLRCAGMENVIGVCVEHGEAAPAVDQNDLLREESSDNRHRDVLATLLELVLFELIPALSPKPRATLSVFVATRARQSREFTLARAVLKFQEKYGYAGDASHVRTLDESSIFPVLAEVLSRRPRSQRPGTINIEHARGVVLAYPTFRTEPWRERTRAPASGVEAQPGVCILIDPAQGGPLVVMRRPKWEKTRHQHYVADLIAGACYRYGREGRGALSVLNISPWSDVFRHGIYDTLDQRLRSLLRAVRLLSRSELEGALLELATLNWDGLPETHSAVPLIADKLARAVHGEMSGVEFVGLAASMGRAARGRPRREMAETKVGVIKQFNPRQRWGYIHDASGAAYRFDVRAWASATDPSEGEPVKFLASRASDGWNVATWVKSQY